jgi:hypothetical protein
VLRNPSAARAVGLRCRFVANFDAFAIFDALSHKSPGRGRSPRQRWLKRQSTTAFDGIDSGIEKRILRERRSWRASEEKSVPNQIFKPRTQQHRTPTRSPPPPGGPPRKSQNPSAKLLSTFLTHADRTRQRDGVRLLTHYPVSGMAYSDLLPRVPCALARCSTGTTCEPAQCQ